MFRPSPASLWVLVACLSLAAGPALAEMVRPAKPVPVSQKRVDKSKVVGHIIAYDEDGFELKLRGGETEIVSWSELDAKTYYAIQRSLLDPKDGAALTALGKALLRMDGGKSHADKAFAAALKVDPDLKDVIDEIKKNPDAVEEPNPPKPARASKGAGKGKGEGGELIRDADAPAEKIEGVEGRPTAGPESVGKIKPEFWRAQTDAQQAESVKQLKAFAEKTQKVMGKELRLNETTYFLFYSELSKQEAKNWSGVLDKMYKKLAEMFAVEKNVNIMRGKALVFVFQKKDDYIRFQKEMHDTDAAGSDGMCHTFGDGMVHIAFYRQPNEIEFAHVLVHESVHGFIHRYKSPHDVPVWVNEGLAEWIASQLVPRAGGQERIHSYAKMFLEQAGSTRGLLEAPTLEDWQYLVAEMLTTYMIEKNRKGYVAFIKAMKDGKPFKEALATHFDTSPDQLVRDFGKALGVSITN